VRLLHGLHSYVNLIPGNETAGYERSEPASILRFQSVLKSAGFESEIRAPRGGEINAACGQLGKRALENKTPAAAIKKGYEKARVGAGGEFQAKRGGSVRGRGKK
jgi:23S rRNA (adenine2503-C2)-methyltransferase